MSGTFLKTTLRHIYREKMYAAINIAGLAIAVACCLILGLWLRNELTYDQHNKKHKQIYRLVTELNTNGKIDKFIHTSQTVGKTLTNEYADVKDYVRFLANRQLLLQYEGRSFYWDKTAYVSNNVFDVFDHEFIYGDPATVKNSHFCAVSESFAKKYWGSENPVGKTVTSEGNGIKITHVFKDLPVNSHYRYDVLFSDDASQNRPDSRYPPKYALWIQAYYTYLVMPEDYDIRNFKDISESFYKRHMAETGKELNMSIRLMIEPLADIHYNSDAGSDFPKGNKYYLYGFIAVGIFILLVACINYINLATARAAGRAEEVGMRKILGSGRARLIMQFLGESITFSFFAMLLGCCLVQAALVLTPINQLLGTKLTLDFMTEPMLAVWIFLFILGFGFISGIYPALYLSSIAPLSALARYKSGKKSIKLRELLVLVQFIISVTVIACTLLMALQMKYIYNKSLGFDKENKLIVTLRTADTIDKIPVIKKELSAKSNILGVSICNKIPGNIQGLSALMIDNNDGIPEQIPTKEMSVGKDFLEVMGIELTAGRGFQEKPDNSVLVNEAMVKKMGWEQPMGKNISINGNYAAKVTGVVKDFHYASLKSDIRPLVIRRLAADTRNVPPPQRNLMTMYLVLNLSPENIPDTLGFLENRLKEFDPEHPFEFEFLEDSLNKLYLSEKNQMVLIGTFAVICIFISCIGLFGLTGFTTEQRKKEIAIRKVSGASTTQIIVMLARNIELFVLGGAVIASLMAYYAIDTWLTEFKYRININENLWIFLIAAAAAMAVTFITVAVQSFRIARSNPVNSIRQE